MVRANKVLIFIFITLFLIQTHHVFAKYHPNYQLDIKGIYYMKAEIEDGDDFASDKNEVRKRDLGIGYRYFLYLSDRLTIIPGVSFERNFFRYIFDDNKLAGHLPDRLQSLRFNLRSNYSINEKWGFLSSVSMGFDSDFEEISTEDGNFNFMLGASYGYSEKLRIFFGTSYSRNFGEDDFFPFAGIFWKPGKHFYINFMHEPEIGWEVNRMLKFGIDGGYLSKAYRLSSKANRAFIKSGIVEEKYIRTGLFIRTGLSRTIGIKISCGMNYNHEYKFFDEDYDDIVLDADMDNSFYLNVNLLFNFMKESP